ncbi:MAG: SLAC1 anion channel family protein [Bacteroidota bacterium]
MVKDFRLQNFPISFFSVILGLTGFTVAFQKVEEILQLTFNISDFVLIFSVIVFLILSVTYLVKSIKYPSVVKEEFNHPIKLNFFPTFPISFILLSIAFLGIDIIISKYLWYTGVIFLFFVTLKILSIWIEHEKFEITHMSPAWFIPPVGSIVIPVAGVIHLPNDILWFFFSVGIMFWLILLIIFFNRIIFHHPLPNKLLPTLFILIAPPAIGFIAFVKLTGEVNEFSKILYYFALFLTILLFSQFKMFRKIDFFLSWWAYSFPISAITLASFLMYHKTEIITFKVIGLILFLLLSMLILLLLYKTIQSIYHKEICVAED